MSLNKDEVFVYIGAYTKESPVGISLFAFHLSTGALRLLETYKDIINPSFLTINKEGTKLYAASETSEYNGMAGGSVAAYDIQPGTGRLTLLNVQPTNGAAPCHLTLDPTEHSLYVANYTSGSLSVFPVQADGSLGSLNQLIQHEGTGPNVDRQEGPHAHSITLDPSGHFAVSADLGNDKLILYKLEEEGRKLVHHFEHSLTPGAGPRHVAFNHEGNRLYAINELDSTVTALKYDDSQGTLATLQTLSTLPDDYKETSYCADIHISADGRFLYGSNRGHDSIVVFTIDSATGMLSPVEISSTLGQTPRNFAIAPNGTFLIAANQDSDSLNVFSIDAKSGKLKNTGISAEVSRPVCVTFM